MTFGEVQRVPGVVRREPFTEEEQQDLGNREARAHYWAKRQAAEDEARAQEVFDQLPADKQSEIRRRFLAGESLEDLSREVVHGGEKGK
jgi:DNA-directed RNA polymerase specialized sigma24 family protein